MRKERKTGGGFRRLLSLTAALLLTASGVPGKAEEQPFLEEKGLALAESRLAYPAVSGMTDETLQRAVNDRLLESLHIREYLNRINQLLSGGSLQVTWKGGLSGGVVSAAVSALGAVNTARREHVWTAANIDLRSGQDITLADVFAQEQEGRAAAEACLENEVLPELSAHLLNAEVTPLPETFLLEREGITFLYPADRLTTLSDRAGAIRLSWNELRDVLDTSADGVPARIGALEMITLTEESGERIRTMAAGGSLTDVPARIGEKLKPLTDQQHLLTDPDVFRDGRLFAPEGASFRGILLMTDYISEAWDDSVVQGIRADRGCWEGLCIGTTTREEWRAVLGEPDSAVTMDEETAEAYRMLPGESDYYRCGDYTLRLHADEAGVLVSLILTQ